MHRRIVAGIAWVSALLSACDCGGGSRAAGGKLVVSPRVVGLGAVPVGLTALRMLQLENTGDGPVRIVDARVTGPLEAELALVGVPAALGSKDEHEVSVVFSPKTPGPREWEVVFETDSKITPQVRVVAQSSAVELGLHIEPDLIDFGAVSLGRTATSAVRVTNSAAEAITIRAVTLDLGTSTEFIGALDGSRTLMPQDSFVLTVGYAPRDGSLDEGRLLIVDDGRAPVPPQLRLRGQGVPTDLAIEPLFLEMREALVGEVRTRALELRNLSASTQIVSRLEVLGTSGEFSIVSSTTTHVPFTLSAGELRRVSVRYAPVDVGSDVGQVLVDSTGLFATARVGLIGSAVAPRAPLARLDVAQIDFGSVEVDRIAARSLWIQNVGSGDLVLSSALEITPAGAPFRILVGPSAGARFAGGDEGRVSIGFSPTEVVGSQAVLRMRTNDRENPTFEVPLVGTGTGPVPGLVVERVLEVGRVPSGERVMRRIELSNEGTLALAIAGVRLASSASGRLVLADAIELPLELSPGGKSAVALVVEDRGAPASWEGRVELSTNDPDTPISTVLVRGETTDARRVPPDLEVEASFDPAAEVDIHLLRRDGLLYDRPSDCSICAPNPDWGLRDVSADDPLLAIDGGGVDGRERVVLGAAADDQYSIIAARPNEGAPARVEVSVRSRGQLIGLASRDLPGGVSWEVVRVTFLGGAADVERVISPIEPLLDPACF